MGTAKRMKRHLAILAKWAARDDSRLVRIELCSYESEPLFEGWIFSDGEDLANPCSGMLCDLIETLVEESDKADIRLKSKIAKRLRNGTR